MGAVLIVLGIADFLEEHYHLSFFFVLYLLQIYHLLKEVDFFVVIKRFENRPVGFSLNNGSFNFFPKVFVVGCSSG